MYLESVDLQVLRSSYFIAMQVYWLCTILKSSSLVAELLQNSEYIYMSS